MVDSENKGVILKQGIRYEHSPISGNGTIC